MINKLSDSRYHPFGTDNKRIRDKINKLKQRKPEWLHIKFLYQTGALSMATVSVAVWQALSANQMTNQQCWFHHTSTQMSISLCFIPVHSDMSAADQDGATRPK